MSNNNDAISQSRMQRQLFGNHLPLDEHMSIDERRRAALLYFENYATQRRANYERELHYRNQLLQEQNIQPILIRTRANTQIPIENIPIVSARLLRENENIEPSYSGRLRRLFSSRRPPPLPVATLYNPPNGGKKTFKRKNKKTSKKRKYKKAVKQVICNHTLKMS
jgi:hypothetical protein